MIYILLLGSIEDILNSQGSISELEDILFLSSDTVLLSDCKDVVDVQLNQGTFDDVCLEVYDKETTQTDIETYEFPKVWHKFVVFYADFENNNLAAGNFDYTISEITSLIIKRRLYNSVEPFLPIFEKQVYSDIGSNEFNFAFTDYLVKNHQEYEYKLVPILKNGIEGLPIYATYEDVRKLDFNGVFICEPNSVYSTFLEVEVTANKDIADTVVKPLGRKYPIVFRGTQNKGYIGTVKGLFAPYITHCEFNFENAWDYRNKLNDFLLDGKSKVLKYDDGRMWLVNIHDQVVNDQDGHEYKIITSFSWVETGDINNVYDLYDNGFISYNPYTKAVEIIDEFDYNNVVYTATVSDGTNNITSATVKLFDKNNNVINTTTTNDLGQFSFNKLYDGEYAITIECDGYITKTTSITVSQHKVIGNFLIELTPIKDETIENDTNRNFLTAWKVLKSTNNNAFVANDVLTNYDNLPSEIENNGVSNTEIILESDFEIKENDDVFISITGTYYCDGTTDDELSEAGFPQCSVTLYTGNLEDEEESYHIITNTLVDLATNTNITEFSSSNNTTSLINGDLKLKLFMESFETPNDNAYSVISNISIYVNGKNIFKVG